MTHANCFGRTIAALVSGLALVGGWSTVHAAPLNVTAVGTIDFVAPEIASTFAIGDTWTMNYTFESTTPARAGSNSNFAVFDALLSTDVSTNNYAASASGAEEIQVDNDPGLGIFDRYSPGPGVTSVLTGATVNGLNLATFYFVLTDSTDTAFSDALILPLDISLSDFDSNRFTIDFVDDLGNVYSASGTLTSLVPEPATYALAACGILGLAMFRRRRSC